MAPHVRNTLVTVWLVGGTTACSQDAGPPAAAPAAAAPAPAAATPAPAPAEPTVPAEPAAPAADPAPAEDPTKAADPAATATVEDLMKEVQDKKTPDARATAALEQARGKGAEGKALAKAATARGKALHGDPERARTFFLWAAEADPKAAEPCFALAQQAVVSGDVPGAREWLTKVKDRGGKKLLAQIDFDPMWEIVKDDPEVRKLLQ